MYHIYQNWESADVILGFLLYHVGSILKTVNLISFQNYQYIEFAVVKYNIDLVDEF
jgi:hypothetical protein